MKILFPLIFIPLFGFGQTDLLKREIEFVSSQRQTLEKQLTQVKLQREHEVGGLNRQLDQFHKEKARLAAELELIENEVADFSRLAKKQLQSQNALSDRLSWIKAKNEEMLCFLPTIEPAIGDGLTDALMRQGQIIETASQVFTAEKSILDSSQSLTRGTVLHLGPFARFLNKNEQWEVLALNDSGYYAQTNQPSFATDHGDSPITAAAFIQLPFQKVQPILKEKNLFNRFVDLLPGLFLVLVFFSIGWIFMQLAKS